MNRQLASLKYVTSVQEHPNADNLDVISICSFDTALQNMHHWCVVAAKGEIEIKSIVVFFEPDSVLPATDERYASLGPGCRVKLSIGNEGYRIKTRKIRGMLSEGLVMPLSMFPETIDSDDFRWNRFNTYCTDLLHVVKWGADDDGETEDDDKRPYFVPKTREPRLQSVPRLCKRLVNQTCYITQKMDGMSISVWCKDGVVGACSRNRLVDLEGDSPIADIVRKKQLVEKMPKLDPNTVLQGDLSVQEFRTTDTNCHTTSGTYLMLSILIP